MHGGGVRVQIREDWSERLARVQLLRRLRILGVHVHDEVRIWSKERHLAFRIATIGAVCVGFKLPDREAVRGLIGGDGDMLAPEWSPCSVRSRAQEYSRECRNNITKPIVSYIHSR